MNQERFRDASVRVARSCTYPRNFRYGFTLVELLMVITVVSILTSLIVVASMSVLGSAREAATRATLSKVNTMLKQRMAAFEIQLDNDYASKMHTFESEVAGMDERVQKVFYRKKLFKKYFPQTWNEASELGQQLGITLPTSASNPDSDAGKRESSEVLYFFLTQRALTSQGEVGQDTFLSSEFVKSNNSDYPYFIDAWGTPLRFYRWPCRLIKPTATSSTDNPSPSELAAARTQIPALTTNTADKALNTDPDDPYDLMNSISSFTTDYHLLKTYHTPLVVSAGVDTLFGLESPIDSDPEKRQARPDYQTSIDNSEPADEVDRQRAELYDNMTNLNALAGGNQ